MADAGLRCLEVQPLVITADVATTRRDAARVGEIAAALRAPWIQSGLNGELDDDAVQALRESAGIVSGHGARLALEYLPFTPIRTIADTRDLIARAGVDARIVVDTWHFFHGPDDWEALESLSLSELAYPQFDDHPELSSDDLMYETTQRRVLPGDGVLDLKRFCAVLRAKGYRGPVSVEILSAEMRAWTPEDFARRVYAAAAPFWS